MKFIRLAGLLLLIVAQLSTAKEPDVSPTAPLFDNLGTLHYPVSTKVPLAQRFFDQGLTLYYGFAWGESIRSFKEAIRLDPNCGMCYWGVAIALLNKINAPMTGHEYQDGKIAIEKALSLKSFTTQKEYDYIKALSLKFHHSSKALPASGVVGCHLSSEHYDVSTKKENIAYMTALKKLIVKYPSDNNIKVLYAAELFWNIAGNNFPYHHPWVISMSSTLKEVLANDPLNIGANHYYIHITEPYAHPEHALASADRLRTLVPGSDHLVHMPSHIYYLTGRYHEAAHSNMEAIKVAKKYVADTKAQHFIPEIDYLYLHNYDFLRSAAMMEGQKQLSLQTVQEMMKEPFSSLLKNEQSLQWYIPVPYFVKARFAMWSDLLKEARPNKKYQYALGMWHYAHGLASLESGNFSAAKQDEMSLANLIKKGPVEAVLEKNGISLLTIADNVLLALIADKKGDGNAVFRHIKAAIRIQDSMGYHEPPDWYFPLKQMLGDAYLQWNLPTKAVIAYKADLKQYPNNGWSLFGLSKSYKRLGNIQEAKRVEKELNVAWQFADIPTPVSLFTEI